MENSQTNLEKTANTYVESKVNEAKKFIDEAFSELVSAPIKSILPEIVFKEYFFDYFFTLSNDTTSPLLLKWLELSGGPYNEVDILNDKGQVIYTVPGIVSRPTVSNGINNKNFNQIAATYELKSNRLVVEGINYLTNELQGVPANINSSADIDAQRWLYIYNYYNLPVANKTQTKAMDNNLLVSAFDYD